MSGTGLASNVRSSVLTPTIGTTGHTSLQLKTIRTSVEGNSALALNDIRKVCAWPAEIETRALGVPVSVLVRGLVVWKENVAGTLGGDAMPQSPTEAIEDGRESGGKIANPNRAAR